MFHIASWKVHKWARSKKNWPAWNKKERERRLVTAFLFLDRSRRSESTVWCTSSLPLPFQQQQQQQQHRTLYFVCVPAKKSRIYSIDIFRICFASVSFANRRVYRSFSDIALLERLSGTDRISWNVQPFGKWYLYLFDWLNDWTLYRRRLQFLTVFFFWRV